MRKDIHPEWYPDAKVLVNGEVIMTVGATKPELHVEIWSGTHPFYTGQQRLVDTEGQVERFRRRLERQAAILQKMEKEEETTSPVNLGLEEMELGTRANNALKDAGLATVGDVLEVLNQGDDALLALPGIGQHILINIKRFMRAEGLIE